MSLTEKKVKRSIREFRDLVSNLLSANHQLYQDRVVKLVEYIKSNKIMEVIIRPFLELDVNYNEYIKKTAGGWTELNLPKSKDEEIALILGILEASVDQNFEMTVWGTKVFRKSNLNEAIYEVNNQLLRPVFQELFNRLDDLVEDKIEGSDQVEPQQLTIIEVGNITATNSNIAVGKEIQQKNKIGLKEEIFKQLLEQGLKIDQLQSINSDIDKFVEEAKKESPDEGKLKKFFKPIFEVGKQVAVNVFTQIFTNPTVTAALSGYVTG